MDMQFDVVHPSWNGGIYVVLDPDGLVIIIAGLARKLSEDDLLPNSSMSVSSESKPASKPEIGVQAVSVMRTDRPALTSHPWPFFVRTSTMPSTTCSFVSAGCASPSKIV